MQHLRITCQACLTKKVQGLGTYSSIFSELIWTNNKPFFNMLCFNEILVFMKGIHCNYMLRFVNLSSLLIG